MRYIYFLFKLFTISSLLSEFIAFNANSYSYNTYAAQSQEDPTTQIKRSGFLKRNHIISADELKKIILKEHNTIKPLECIVLDANLKPVNIKNIIGRLNIFYFWSSWSLDSRVSIKQLDELQHNINAYNYNNIKVIPINMDFKTPKEIKKFYKKNNITSLPIYLDTKNEFFNKFDMRRYPATVIMENNKNILAKINKSVNWSDVRTLEILRLSVDDKQALLNTTEGNVRNTKLNEPISTQNNSVRMIK